MLLLITSVKVGSTRNLLDSPQILWKVLTNLKNVCNSSSSLAKFPQFSAHEKNCNLWQWDKILRRYLFSFHEAMLPRLACDTTQQTFLNERLTVAIQRYIQGLQQMQIQQIQQITNQILLVQSIETTFSIIWPQKTSIIKTAPWSGFSNSWRCCFT